MQIGIEDELACAVEKAGLGLELERAKPLLDAFQPAFAEARDLIAESLKIQVTDATQVSEIKASRALRLKLRAVRVAVEKTRKELKEEALRQGKAIDGLANVLKFLIEPAEERLQAQEEYAERKEAERKAELKASRESLLAPYGVDASFYQLGDMPEATFAQLLDSSRIAHEARLEAARKAEEARVEAERKRVEEEKRIREENAKLKAEQDRLERERAEADRKAKAALAAAEAKAEAERIKAEAAAKQEREARKKVERELAERKRIEEEERAEAEAAKKKAAKAPDKEKLSALASSLLAIELPKPSTSEGKAAVANIKSWIEDLARRIRDEAQGL